MVVQQDVNIKLQNWWFGHESLVQRTHIQLTVLLCYVQAYIIYNNHTLLYIHIHYHNHMHLTCKTCNDYMGPRLLTNKHFTEYNISLRDRRVTAVLVRLNVTHLYFRSPCGTPKYWQCSTRNGWHNNSQRVGQQSSLDCWNKTVSRQNRNKVVAE